MDKLFWKSLNDDLAVIIHGVDIQPGCSANDKNITTGFDVVKYLKKVIKGKGRMQEPDSLEKLETMAEWMDNRFVIPGTSIRFGVDSLLGLIPGVGDTATIVTTVYLIGRAQSYGVPGNITVRMIWNAFIDWFIGLFPLIGDIFDIGWKANKRNVALLRGHVEQSPAAID